MGLVFYKLVMKDGAEHHLNLTHIHQIVLKGMHDMSVVYIGTQSIVVSHEEAEKVRMAWVEAMAPASPTPK